MAGVGSPVVPSGLMVRDAFVVHGLTPMTACRHFVAIAHARHFVHAFRENWRKISNKSSCVASFLLRR